MTATVLRPYQQTAIDSVLDYWREGGGNPLVDMATGLGKSVVIGTLTRDLIAQYRDMRVLMLVHVRELVTQNAQALLRLWPQAPLGIYSAGLGKRQAHRQVTFASIQSVFRLPAAVLGPIDLVLIDEAHLVPSGGDGMYLKLLEKLRDMRADMRVAGFTATPFRLDTGRLDDGEGRLFDDIVYSYGVREGIEDGWLAPLVSKATAEGFNLSGVKKAGGEFVAGALEAAVDKDPITRAAVAELTTLGADRRSWLVFCAGVNHAHHVAEAIRAHGVTCATITGETPSGERDWLIREFKGGRLRALTNANVLTTGFDSPGVDLIAMLRPTLSTGLYVQMCGRGTRLADGKENCLVLDFAGNVRRHGPVDTVEVESKRKGGSDGDGKVREESVRAKVCPDCQSYVALNARECTWCGHQWQIEVKPKHEATADAETPILSTGPKLSRAAQKMLPDDQPVIWWKAERHTKPDAPDSLKVTYGAGLLTFPEWVLIERDGWLGEKAKAWWRMHWGETGDVLYPQNVGEALALFDRLKRPDIIQTRVEGGYHRIVGRKFKPHPEERAA
ncbi:MAG TPA: DEAD/DEAH box helicase family protein [Caulobacteraceae bacterium]|jgi:DNA repair protein RadD|nr:DEAD/DEAH box helicase family protein [Caulobacteraceae bacterium]